MTRHVCCFLALGDNGSLYFYDWKTGYNFQQLSTPAQPGSLDSEAGIFAMEYDMSGSRIITAEADKSIKIYREDESAVGHVHVCDGKLMCSHWMFVRVSRMMCAASCFTR